MSHYDDEYVENFYWDDAGDFEEHSDPGYSEDFADEADGDFDGDFDGVEEDDLSAIAYENWRADESERFAHPGGNSALRAASRGNPRNLPCPTCGTPNRLTPADRDRGYQCDRCADRDEMGGY